jgi:hypothetical protein
MERYGRKNKGGNHKELQDLDLISFPHRVEKVIGGNVDLDLLSLFPQKDSRSMGGMEEGGQAFKVNNGGVKNPNRVWLTEEQGVFIGGWKSGCWKMLEWDFGDKFGRTELQAGQFGARCGETGWRARWFGTRSSGTGLQSKILGNHRTIRPCTELLFWYMVWCTAKMSLYPGTIKLK